MSRIMSAYLVGLVIFLIIDAIWLGIVARSFYASRIGGIMLDSPRFGVAAIFYALFVVGLCYFAILPALAAGSVGSAALNGALFGFFCYLTWNATNLSAIRGFDELLAVVDTSWGTILGGTVATLTFLVVRRLGLG